MLLETLPPRLYLSRWKRVQPTCTLLLQSRSASPHCALTRTVPARHSHALPQAGQTGRRPGAHRPRFAASSKHLNHKQAPRQTPVPRLPRRKAGTLCRPCCLQGGYSSQDLQGRLFDRGARKTPPPSPSIIILCVQAMLIRRWLSGTTSLLVWRPHASIRARFDHFFRLCRNAAGGRARP